MTRREIKRELKAIMDAHVCQDEQCVPGEDGGDVVHSEYLGPYMSLDPCGRYHHCLSPNGISKRCDRYWNNLDECASELGACVLTGEGDPTDVYLEW